MKYLKKLVITCLTLERSLYEISSNAADFVMLTSPAGAKTYDELISKSFYKDQTALYELVYYWKLLRDKGSRETAVLDTADRHFQVAINLRAQADNEVKSLLAK